MAFSSFSRPFIRKMLDNKVTSLAVSTTLTKKAYAGNNNTILMGGAGSARTFTLPAATGTGDVYKFVVGAVNTSNYVIKVANASDVMYGNVITNSTGDTPDLAQPWPTAADSDTITLNGTTQGGVAVGDFITVQDIATNKWSVFGVTTSSGAEATPFSAGV